MMSTEKFGIEVNFLTGRYIATSHHDRKQSEWPPHPARLFSALVATWTDADEPDPSEREALEWLETQQPPAITASTAVSRTVGSHFVPVNDTTVIGKYEDKAEAVYDLADQLHDALVASGGEVTEKITHLQSELSKKRNLGAQVGASRVSSSFPPEQMFPDRRGKQERFFPSLTPENPRVTYIWNDRPSDRLNDVLDDLLGRVTRLGHAASLVSCRSVPDPPEATYIPGGNGESLRNVRRGQIAELERQYCRHGGIKPRSLPYVDVPYQTEKTPSKEPLQEPNTVGRWIVFEFAHKSRAMPVTRTVELAKAMRSAIFRYAKDPLQEELSGHRPGGAPALMPHVAFLPLPYAGFSHADGRLLGIAVSMPETLSDIARQQLLHAIGTWEKQEETSSLKLTLGAHGVVEMSRLRGPATLISLHPEVWRTPSRRWISATPIALPRHPGELTRGTQTARAKAWAQAETAVVAACAHVGLSEPSAVEVSLNPFITGTRTAARFPAFNQSARNGQPIRRQLIHAALTFEHKVAGPLMLGSGRFLGLGLMRPESDSEGGQSPQEQN